MHTHIRAAGRTRTRTGYVASALVDALLRDTRFGCVRGTVRSMRDVPRIQVRVRELENSTSGASAQRQCPVAVRRVPHWQCPEEEGVPVGPDGSMRALSQSPLTKSEQLRGFQSSLQMLVGQMQPRAIKCHPTKLASASIIVHFHTSRTHS